MSTFLKNQSFNILILKGLQNSKNYTLFILVVLIKC